MLALVEVVGEEVASSRANFDEETDVVEVAVGVVGCGGDGVHVDGFVRSCSDIFDGKTSFGCHFAVAGGGIWLE